MKGKAPYLVEGRSNHLTVTLADGQNQVDERHDDFDVRFVAVHGADGLDNVGKHLPQLILSSQRRDHGSTAAERQIRRERAEKDDDAC